MFVSMAEMFHLKQMTDKGVEQRHVFAKTVSYFDLDSPWYAGSQCVLNLIFNSV